jgi:hypothetical protein
MHTITGVGFPAWPVGDGVMIVRYSSGHIICYPHPELLFPIIKFVVLATSSIFSSIFS